MAYLTEAQRERLDILEKEYNELGSDIDSDNFDELVTLRDIRDNIELSDENIFDILKYEGSDKLSSVEIKNIVSKIKELVQNADSDIVFDWSNSSTVLPEHHNEMIEKFS